MADIDYAALAVKVQAIIDANGRTVTFERFQQTAGDPDKPWQGPTDPRGTPDASAEEKAVFVPMGSAASLGLEALDDDLLKRTQEVALVGPAAFDLATANEVVDAGVRKKVTFVRTLRPNTVTLLYYVGVDR